MISDTEIPLAILHCNTERYCNPKYYFTTFLKLETQKFRSSDIIIENTQDVVNTDVRSIKRKIIPETCESQDNLNVSKKIRCFDENERISDIDESNIAIMQNIDNEKFKCKIIPETCDSQTNKNISKNSYPFYESEWKYRSDKSEFAINNMQNVDNKEIKRNVTDKTYDLQNNENISAQSFNESKQRYVSDTSKSNVLAKTQDKSIKSIYVSNEQNNISDRNKSNIVKNIFSKNTNKQFPDSYSSVEKNLSDIFSGKSNNKEVHIFETCKFNNELVGNIFATKKEQQNIKLQEKEIFKKSNMTFVKNNQEKNITRMLQENECDFQQQRNSIINEEDNTIFKKNLDRQKNSIVEKDNLSNNNGEVTIARWKNSKNAKPRIVSIQVINDSEIDIGQGKENLFEKDCSRVELQDSLKKQKLSSICNSEENQDKRVKEDKIQTKDNKKEESRKTVS